MIVIVKIVKKLPKYLFLKVGKSVVNHEEDTNYYQPTGELYNNQYFSKIMLS